MAIGDLAMVDAIAARVHPDFPEDAAVFAERLLLYPDGCHVLAAAADSVGYLISHPWCGRPPSLNSLIRRIPPEANTYYVHDLALLPSARGSGAAATIVEQLVEQARRLQLASVSLVAVNGSVPFWEKQGFVVVAQDHDATGYGEDARRMVRHLA
ncbi:GNAT family N-acetyltransferase [Bradyrhizobium sp. ORS 285]|uniref:GNAT family N-acetyltransferase n=1 Tax=Bradyrhizobium sp. ORS 285 TaxID=115808 RepID=UPI0002FE97B2|nr:GNAT family N-acetyltransferase [Bradyrhizobium sp. ORS 285]